MKKSIAGDYISWVRNVLPCSERFRFVDAPRLKTCSCFVSVLLTACTTSHVQWDAVQMRRHVIDYYNDEIMENLIRAKNQLPFVHVDIATLSAVSGARIAGTITGGQTLNNTGSRQATDQTVTTNTMGTSTTVGSSMSHMVATTVGVVGTATRMATRPFTVSATPEHSDTLTIVSYPVVGSEAAQKINTLYVNFLKLADSGGASSVRVADNPDTLTEGKDYVPDTMKKWRDGRYYYVPTYFAADYSILCSNIFAVARAKPASFIQTTPLLLQQ